MDQRRRIAALGRTRRTRRPRGRQIHQFNVGDTVRVVGMVRGGQGRVDISELFAQEDDVLEFLVTPQGIHDLHHLLQGDLP